MIKICIINNYDSFTYNIFHLLETIGCNVLVLQNNCTINNISTFNPDKLIISPGPGIQKNLEFALKLLITLKIKFQYLVFAWGIKLLQNILVQKLFQQKKSFMVKKV